MCRARVSGREWEGHDLKDFRKNSVIMIVLTAFSSGINYLSQIIMGKVLAVPSFGIMNSLFSLILVLNVFGTSVNMLTAKKVAEQSGDPVKISVAARQMTQISLIVGAGFLAAGGIIGLGRVSLFGAAPVALAFVAGIIATNIFPYIISGILTGQGRFIAAGLFSLIVPLFKICGVLTVRLWTGELRRQVWILGLMLVGNLVSTALFRRVLYPPAAVSSSSLRREDKVLPDQSLLLVTGSNFMYLLFANMDILLINQFCGAEEGGIYSASMLFGRIIFYFTAAVVSVLLPYAAKENHAGGSAAGIFRGSLCIILAASAVCIIPLIWAPELFIRLVYGETYLAAVRYIPFSCGIAVMISLFNLELNYFIGTGCEKRILIDQSAALAAMILLLIWRHGNAEDILVDLLCVLTGLFFIKLPGCIGKTAKGGLRK